MNRQQTVWTIYVCPDPDCDWSMTEWLGVPIQCPNHEGQGPTPIAIEVVPK